MAEIEAKGDVSRSDWYRWIRGHEDNRREREREREEKERMKAETQKKREDLMRTSSTVIMKSIMPQVKSSVANKQFLSSGNAIQSVIGDRTFSRKGGRRTKRQKKRSNKKRSGNKRSSHKSRRR